MSDFTTLRTREPSTPRRERAGLDTPGLLNPGQGAGNQARQDQLGLCAAGPSPGEPATEAQVQAFAAAFRGEFQRELHAFPPTDAELFGLFTAGQREKLRDFLCSHRIPDRLFNGDEQGRCDAGQRILLSAHILAVGQHRPEGADFDQRVYAHYCYHWAELVYHYAGVTTPARTTSRGTMGSFDHAGNVVLGATSAAPGYHGARVREAQLPEEEGEDLGPLQGAQREAAERRRAEHPDQPTSFARQRGLPFERVLQLQPGDWVWVYNANRSADGGHSAIFSHWEGEAREQDGVRFRLAAMYSQMNNEVGGSRGGGHAHRSWLGDRYARLGDITVTPVVHITRVQPDAHPARTAAELYPARRGDVAGSANEQFLRAIGRRHGGTISPDALRGWLRARNRELAARLRPRLSDTQARVFEEANAREELETLVRHLQRLRSLVEDADALGAAQQRAGATRNPAQAAWAQQDEELRARAGARTRELDEEQAAADASRRTHQSAIEAIERTADERRIQGELEQIRRQRRAAGSAEEREALEARRQALARELAELRRERSRQRPEVGVHRQVLAALTNQDRRRAGRRRAVEAELADHEERRPFFRAHPQPQRPDAGDRITGRLQDLSPPPPWAELVTRAPASPGDRPAASPSGP